MTEQWCRKRSAYAWSVDHPRDYLLYSCCNFETFVNMSGMRREWIKKTVVTAFAKQQQARMTVLQEPS